MEIKEQESTYTGFIKWTVRTTIACVAILILMKVALV
ncbi:aa3-type cytochrome c oxidase subunit IV [Kordiimonas sediminis]|nr:aa3-type cytochrome c oxidase subunit IV [Kordiimonas sediminis]